MLKYTPATLLILMALTSAGHAQEKQIVIEANESQLQPTTPSIFDKIATPDNISLKELNRNITGTWQCQDTTEFLDNIISYHATLHYKADGTLISRKVSHSADGEDSGSYTVHTKKSWHIMPSDNNTLWVMAERIDDTTYFSVENQALEDKIKLREFLASKPVYESLIILQHQGVIPTLSLIDPLSGYRSAYCHKTSNK